jgi:hypothetical protein
VLEVPGATAAERRGYLIGRQFGVAVANLGIVDVRRARAGGPRLPAPRSGSTPRQFALEPGSTKLLVVDTHSGQVPACQIAQLP